MLKTIQTGYFYKMTIEERVEKANMLRHSHACNCCQAVATVLSDQVDLSENDLWNICCAFGGGMGGMEGVCGAVIGAVIIIGLRIQSRSASAKSNIFSSKFKSVSGALLCKELKGRDTGIVVCPCDKCVENALRIYDSMAYDLTDNNP